MRQLDVLHRLRWTVAPAIALTAVGALVVGGGVAAGNAVEGARAPATSVAKKAQKASADIDGDGAADKVAVRAKKLRCVVKVRTAAGEKSTLRWKGETPHGCRLHGTAPLDADAGDEIVVLAEMGAHTGFHRVLTWQDGDLARQKAPKRAGIDGLWVTDSALNFAAGIKAKKPGTLVVTRVSRGPNGGKFRGKRFVASYDDGAWSVTKVKKVTMRAKRATRMAGWHVPGLPR